MSNNIENTSFENMTLDKLKELFSSGSELDREQFFNDLLFCIEEPDYLTLITFLNKLCHEYNQYYSKSATREKAKTYHRCIYAVFDWLLPFLDTYDRLVLYTNICILSDDDADTEFHNEHFDVCLKNANKFVEQLDQRVGICINSKTEDVARKKVLCKALDNLGFLNLREHSYGEAILCFRPCVNILSDSFWNPDTESFIDPNAKKLYFNSIVRMANCFEYQELTWDALKYMLDLPSEEDTSDQTKWVKQIVQHADVIHDKILEYYMLPARDTSFAENSDAKKQTFPTVIEICAQLLNPKTAKKPLAVFDLDSAEKGLHPTVKQYIHVLAHCLSEYAAKMRRLDTSISEDDVFPSCSTLQLVSRFLLDWLVTSCGETSLVSCQATIRAENDACPEAISLLLQRYHSLEKKEENLNFEIKILENKDTLTEEETITLIKRANERIIYGREITEISFYLFYFSEQELRFNYKDERLEQIFRKYGKLFKSSAEKTAKEGDYDPLFHYYVIQVKYLLKRKAESLLRVNESTDYHDLDYEFAQMCTLKEKCSDHIFTGLTDEYQRLVNLYSIFQKCRWLTKDTYRIDILDELYRLASYDDIDGYIKAPNGTIKYEELISCIFEGIRKRNKILILAPVKDAPSCSSEFEEIKELLEISTSSPSGEEKGNPILDCLYSVADKQDSFEVQLKELNDQQDVSDLKFAVHIDMAGSTHNRIVIGITYLYIKRGGSVKEEYREAVPLFMEEMEATKLAQLIQEIDKQLIPDLQVMEKGRCPRGVHDSLYGSHCCTYYIPFSDADDKLLKNIADLLVFLEYDFHASLQYPVYENDIILVSYSRKPGHQFFAILVYDKKTPKVVGNRGFCSLCESFCVEQLLNIETVESVEGKPQGAEETAGFCKTYPYDTEKIIMTCLVKLNQVMQENNPDTENWARAEALEKKIAASCAQGNCVCVQNQEDCYVENAKKTWRW